MDWQLNAIRSVYLATDPSGRRVALKRVRMENEREGFPVTAIREIKILQALSGHKNLVALLGVISGRGPATAGGDALTGTYLVFEYLDHDLNGLRAVQMHPAQIKYYLKQIFEGLYFLHKCKIVHRDIKGANILIGNDHVVKLADFGLARAAVDPRPAPTASSLVSDAEAAKMNAQQLAHLVAERQRKHAQNEAIACSYTNRVVRNALAASH
jgi:serine/threonine protein kinase